MTVESQGWSAQTAYSPAGNMHVWPVDDLIEHVLGDDERCICGPRVVMFTEEGESVYVITHHALDGRDSP